MKYEFVIYGRHYKHTRKMPGLNEYLHECACHPQAGASMKKKYKKIVSDAVRSRLGKIKIDKPVFFIIDFMNPINGEIK